jgi:hypothetical protein
MLLSFFEQMIYQDRATLKSLRRSVSPLCPQKTIICSHHFDLETRSKKSSFINLKPKCDQYLNMKGKTCLIFLDICAPKVIIVVLNHLKHCICPKTSTCFVALCVHYVTEGLNICSYTKVIPRVTIMCSLCASKPLRCLKFIYCTLYL